MHLADPAEAKRGRTKKAKTDKLDARWLVLLLVMQDLPEAWIPPEEIPQLRARTRLRKSLADDRTRWAQRLHVVLYHGGWSCRRSQLLTQKGRQWVATLQLTGAGTTAGDDEPAADRGPGGPAPAPGDGLRRFAEQDPRC